MFSGGSTRGRTSPSASVRLDPIVSTLDDLPGSSVENVCVFCPVFIHLCLEAFWCTLPVWLEILSTISVICHGLSQRLCQFADVAELEQLLDPVAFGVVFFEDLADPVGVTVPVTIDATDGARGESDADE